MLAKGDKVVVLENFHTKDGKVLVKKGRTGVIVNTPLLKNKPYRVWITGHKKATYIPTDIVDKMEE